jgi:hypothetical protein
MGKGKVEVTGPVFEKETGRPEFTRAAWELTESLAKAGEGRHMDDAKAATPAGIYTGRVLERYDRINQQKLLAEARAFDEAEQTSDLNLPYSVARMLIEQAYPELVAANVYDFGVTDVSPAKIFYEAYAGESGASATVTDEVVAASLAGWVQLANKRIRPGTVVLTHTSGSPTYAEGTDYVVDYEEGKFMALATITDAQALKADYVADLFRRGEGVGEARMARGRQDHQGIGGGDLAGARVGQKFVHPTQDVVGGNGVDADAQDGDAGNGSRARGAGSRRRHGQPAPPGEARTASGLWAARRSSKVLSRADRRRETPWTSMVTPYSVSAVSMVRLLWVMTMNWACSVKALIKVTNRVTLASSSGASTSSRMAKGAGRTM